MLDLFGTLWLHLKTNHLYVVLGHCQLEAEDRRAVLYHRVDGDGPTWARDEEEFLDGRFAEVSAASLEQRGIANAD